MRIARRRRYAHVVVRLEVGPNIRAATSGKRLLLVGLTGDGARAGGKSGFGQAMQPDDRVRSVHALRE
jgi:hypothetical protein